MEGIFIASWVISLIILYFLIRGAVISALENYEDKRLIEIRNLMRYMLWHDGVNYLEIKEIENWYVKTEYKIRRGPKKERQNALMNLEKEYIEKLNSVLRK